MTYSIWTSLPIIIAMIGLLLLALAIRKRQAVKLLKALNDTREERLSQSSAEELITHFEAEAERVSKLLVEKSDIALRLETALKDNLLAVAKIDAGLVPPAFGHDDSESLKAKVKASRLTQYEVIKSGDATVAYSSWTMFGSEEQGAQMVSAYRHLLLRAFNAEFDAIRKQMRFKTKATARKKLRNLENTLAKLGETVKCHISDYYLDLKLDELDLWWEELAAREQQKQEKKEQLAILREQAKDKAPDTEDVEDEISYKYSDLKKARQLAEKLSGFDAKQAQAQVDKLAREVKALEEKYERATAQAQITRAGYVYVISNVGSFGEGIIKIGMTRRLEPLDRVRELGDASVPYRFDVHALVFVKNAPKLERALHKVFAKRRVNKENLRKEFFRASPLEVQAVLKKVGIETEWFFEPEAREYRESELLRATRLKRKSKTRTLAEGFPEAI